MSIVDEAIEFLEQRSANLADRDFLPWVEKLGFAVRVGSQGAHRTVKHAGLSEFLGWSYNAGTNPIKRNYILKFRRILIERKDELNALLGESND